ncbi:hypothetical protein FRC08_008379 [Ceratobasidium sp. 394]|nr:hypothetical protein FRC08_008379 [Ceratobasidium sp. 394]
MLIHAPSPAGRAYVAECINSCVDDEAVVNWGGYFIQYFTKYFKTRRRHPTPSDHPSRPDLDALRDEILASLDEAPQDYHNAKQQALIRDGYRCMLSGAVDTRSYMRSATLQRTLDVNVAPTECAHILPQYVNQGLDDAWNLHASSTVWAVLQNFGPVQVPELNGPRMHHLSNILTLQCGYHTSFDNLYIWLDPIDGTEHQYTIGRSAPALHTDLPAVVTFTSTDPRLPLPNRRYLALHAACAKVISMSGAGESIDKILDDAMDTKVLSEDGTSGGLLANLLSAEALMAH